MAILHRPRWVAALAFLLAAAAAAIPHFKPRLLTYAIEAGSIRHREGHSYAAQLPVDRLPAAVARILLGVRADSPEVSPSSNVSLMEDGVRVGTAHALHADIARTGRGLFSHWQTGFIFSSSDNSDPRTNGRRYAATHPITPSPWLSLALLFAVVASLSPEIRASFARLRRSGSPGASLDRAVVAGALASVLAGAAGLVLHFHPPSAVRAIEASSIRPWGGHAYAVPAHDLSRSGAARAILEPIATDTNETPSVSRLGLLEQGVAIGAPHSIHVEIVGKGNGRFSHWGNDLIFSTSDNSNPIENGRRYALKYPVAPAFWLPLLLLAAGAVGLATRARTIAGGLRGKGLSRRWLAPVLVALWPFLFLAPYTLGALSPGNDFFYLYYNYKAHVVSLWSQGFLPLWAPSEGSGFPLYSNPFVQYSYPLNLVYLAYSWATGSFTPWDYALFTIGAFAIFGLGLYFWLRRLGIGIAMAVTATLVALMSLKLNELIRFPNAAHSAAWMPWLLYAMTAAAQRDSYLRGLAVFGACCVMLLTAGYPYFVIYTPFLIAPYAVALLFHPVRRALLGDAEDALTPRLRLVLGLCAAGGLAAVVAAPWLLEVQGLMAQTVDRGKPDFAYATAHAFGWIASLGSWIYPPVSPQEGWYYFGMVTTLIAGVFVLDVVTGGVRRSRARTLGICILLWLLTITYFTWGRESLLFTFVWHHVPVLDQLRVWGRMNIILVPPITLLLAIALESYFASARSGELRKRLALLFGLAVLCLGGQVLLARETGSQGYWNAYFKLSARSGIQEGLPWDLMKVFDERLFMLMTLVSWAALTGAAYLAFKGRLARQAAACLIVALSVLDLAFIANSQWANPFVRATPAVTPAKIADQFSRPRVLHGGTVDLVGTNYAAAVENWGFDRHMKFYRKYFDRDGNPIPGRSEAEIAAARRLFGADDARQRLFLSDRIDHAGPLEFVQDVDRTAGNGKPSARKTGYDGDSLDVEVDSGHDVWLTFVDNWDANWEVTLNGAPAPLHRLFGSYKSVRIPAGKWIVRYRYNPRPIALCRVYSRLFSEEPCPGIGPR